MDIQSQTEAYLCGHAKDDEPHWSRYDDGNVCWRCCASCAQARRLRRLGVSFASSLIRGPHEDHRYTDPSKLRRVDQ